MRSIRPHILPLLGYALLTVIFLWPAIHPFKIATHLQGLDSHLMTSIMQHSSRALFTTGTPLGAYPIFYPSQHSLYLSEAMLTPAVLMAPIIHTAGQVLASNLWTYLCWWSLAVSVYLFLRRLAFHPLAAFWGGFFIAFCPDRSWHLVGHMHLYYHTGVFLGALALMQIVATAGAFRWKCLFAFAMITQAFAGLYINTIFLMWGAIVYPALFVLACNQSAIAIMPTLRRHLPFFLGTLAFIALLYAPLLHGYTENNKDHPHIPLDRISLEAGTLRGYLVPPNVAGRLTTLSGLLVPPDTSGTNWEDAQYPGVLGLITLPAALLLIVATWRRRHQMPGHLAPLMLALCIAALLCFVLSLGPYINVAPRASRRLPYAFLYDWLPVFRFFRASPRFATGVMWSLGLLSAWLIHTVTTRCRQHGHPRRACTFAAACLSFTILDFYPLYIIPTGPVKMSDITRHLKQTNDTAPFVAIGMDETHLLSQIGAHPAPMVNGYSGYAPCNRAAELAWFDQHFPAPSSLALLHHWQTRRVRIGRDHLFDKRLRELAIYQFPYTVIAEDEDSMLIEFPDDLPSVEVLAAVMRQQTAHDDSALTVPLALLSNHHPDPTAKSHGIRIERLGMKPRPDNQWQYLGGHATVSIRFDQRPLQPAAYTTLALEYRLSNWYDLRELACIEWLPVDETQFHKAHRIEFVVHVNGQYATVEIPLNQSVAWCASQPITELRIDLGRQVKNRLELRSVRLE